MEKPGIAIKEPVIGDGVSKYLTDYLEDRLSVVLEQMEASLLATRKFDVLTRQQDKLEQLVKEQDFGESDFAKEKGPESGLLEAADYIAVPTVQDFKFYRSTKSVPNISNKYVRQDSGMLEISAQVLDTETAAIKTTFQLKSSFRTGEQVVNSKGGRPSSVHFTRMAKDVAAKMADQLVDAVFPMRILNAEAGTVWVNRGEDGGLDKGDVLKVFRPGKELVDPYTGEKLGSAERMIGKIKVIRVNPKFTIAKVLQDSQEEPVQAGYIVREP